MPTALSDATRFAIFTRWPSKCVWCDEPIAYREMEVDHLIPQMLGETGVPDEQDRAQQLAQLIEDHGLPIDFDLYSEENLAPACRRCNGFKGKRPPAASGFVGLVLSRAADYADDIRQLAATAISEKRFQNALGVISATDKTDDQLLDAIRAHLPELEELVATLAATTESIAITSLINAEPWNGRWRITRETPNGVKVVLDPLTGQGGYTGPGVGFQCPNCGMNGPWNGVVCMSCHTVSDPAD